MAAVGAERPGVEATSEGIPADPLRDLQALTPVRRCDHRFAEEVGSGGVPADAHLHPWGCNVFSLRLFSVDGHGPVADEPLKVGEPGRSLRRIGPPFPQACHLPAVGLLHPGGGEPTVMCGGSSGGSDDDGAILEGHRLRKQPDRDLLDRERGASLPFRGGLQAGNALPSAEHLPHVVDDVAIFGPERRDGFSVTAGERFLVDPRRGPDGLDACSLRRGGPLRRRLGGSRGDADGEQGCHEGTEQAAGSRGDSEDAHDAKTRGRGRGRG